MKAVYYDTYFVCLLGKLVGLCVHYLTWFPVMGNIILILNVHVIIN